MSSCTCQEVVVTSPSGETLPSVEDNCAIANPQSVCKTCPSDDESLRADTTDGTTLPNSWLDAQCHTDDLTILARIGQKLARFTGTGFIALDSGVARVVSSVPLKLVRIWHNWWKPTPTSSPILGSPLPYSYMAIGDEKGNLHAIQGPADEDASPVWDSASKQFTQKPLSENLLPRKGVVTSVSNLELVGYRPIPDGGDPEMIRNLQALLGSGIVYLEQQATISDDCDCAPGSGTASVARSLAFPEPSGSETYSLKYSTALGLHWTQDT